MTFDQKLSEALNAPPEESDVLEPLPKQFIEILNSVIEPIQTVDLLDWSYDNLGSEAGDWQREIYKYLKVRGMLI
jgi:hypothetical protein